MKICLLKPNRHSRFQINPPLGLGCIASSTDSKHVIEIFDAQLENLSPVEAAKKIHLKINPNVIGIQVYTGDHHWVRKFIEWYKSLYSEKTKIICGGFHVTALGEIAIKYLNCDYGIMGNGMPSWHNLINEIDSDNEIKERLITSYSNKFVNPYYEKMNIDRYFAHLHGANIPLKGKRPLVFMATRGCPFSCNFCASHIVHGRIVKRESYFITAKRIQDLIAKYDIDEIIFADDNLIYDKDWAKKLFKFMIKMKLNIHWKAPGGIRADIMDEELSELMAESGCYYVGLGIESGSKRMLKLMNKNLNLDQVEGTVNILKINEIKTSGFFILGYPGENDEDIEKSIRFSLEVPFDRIQVSKFIPYPGSKIFDILYSKYSMMDYQEDDFNTIYDNVHYEMYYGKWIRKFYLRLKIIKLMLKDFNYNQLKTIIKHPQIKEVIKWNF